MALGEWLEWPLPTHDLSGLFDNLEARPMVLHPPHLAWDAQAHGFHGSPWNLCGGVARTGVGDAETPAIDAAGTTIRPDPV